MYGTVDPWHDHVLFSEFQSILYDNLGSILPWRTVHSASFPAGCHPSQVCVPGRGTTYVRTTRIHLSTLCVTDTNSFRTQGIRTSCRDTPLLHLLIVHTTYIYTSPNWATNIIWQQQEQREYQIIEPSPATETWLRHITAFTAAVVIAFAAFIT